MKTLSSYRAAIVIGLSVAILPVGLSAKPRSPENGTNNVRQNCSGPRLGFTYVPGDNEVWRKLDDKNMGRMFTQFGWQFEYVVVPKGRGPSYVIEFLPLIAGVEYGRFIPSGTLTMGIRAAGGFEFAVGPTVLPWKAALSIQTGTSIHFDETNIPVRLIYTHNPDGSIISLLVGYAIGKAKSES